MIISEAKLEARVQEAIGQLTEQLAGEGAQNDFLMERLADLELALDDVGWARLSMETDWEFSREGLDRIVALSRLNAIKNPLIRRGVGIKAQYVFGQGVEIAALDPTINDDVIQPFLDDRGNAAELFAATASQSKDRALTTDGQVCLILFPNKLTGHVNVRSCDVNEIRDIIVNPEDRQDVWFYLRRWTERRWALDGAAFGMRVAHREAWYPDWRHQPTRPADRPESIDRIQVRWDSPIYHVKVGGLDSMRFGIPETYAAIDWARAYKLFLEDWATIVRSLSRFAMKMTVKRNPAAAARRLGATAAAGAAETNPSPVTGSTFVASEGVDLQAIPKTDATVAAEDGVWLAKMVAAALEIPYTILMGDPDMGNLATAKTLDRPTELGMMSRQDVWAEVYRDLGGYAIDWAIRAPGGKLAGREERDADGHRIWVLDDTTINGKVVDGAKRRTIQVTFPPILEDDLKARIESIVMAAGTELPSPVLILRLLLQALGVEDIDEIIEAFPEEQQKRAAERAAAAQQAVAAFRRGQDPAEDL